MIALGYQSKVEWLFPGSLVVVEEVIGEAMEQRRLLGTEETVVNLINGLLQLRVALVVLARIVPTTNHRDRSYTHTELKA